jgi:PadR family transcriptional regulator, regulatory protein PadR
MRDNISHFEMMILLALIRLGDDAYGVPITKELEGRSGRQVSVASVYVALERLSAKGFVVSDLGEPTPERGGRAKRFFRITAKGMREVRNTRRVLMNFWESLPGFKGTR